MKIMGIDPGLAKTGWGIIKVHGDEKPDLIGCGCINSSDIKSNIERLRYIYDELFKLIDTYSPDEVAIEELFFSSNTKTALSVAQAKGVIIIALSSKNLKIVEYTPLQIKQALVGYGRATKKQVEYMVKNFLCRQDLRMADHVFDSLAAALCHHNTRNLSNIIAHS